MSHQLKDPENSHNAKDVDDFSCSTNDLFFLQLVEETCLEKRDCGEKVHRVHGLNKTSNVEKVKEKEKEENRILKNIPHCIGLSDRKLKVKMENAEFISQTFALRFSSCAQSVTNSVHTLVGHMMPS